MNLKDRGVTVGDLLIILILIISSTILIKSLNILKTIISMDEKCTSNKIENDEFNLIIFNII